MTCRAAGCLPRWTWRRCGGGTVDMEDRLRLASWLRSGGLTPTVQAALQPPPPPRSRKEMLSFVDGVADWKAALADAKTAEAMRRVRSRVRSLADEGRAASTFAPVLLNAVCCQRHDPCMCTICIGLHVHDMHRPACARYA